jgi:YHS domain-containing protein
MGILDGLETEQRAGSSANTMRLMILFLLMGCAGPAQHGKPAEGTALNPSTGAAPRLALATTLTAPDPLATRPCELPSTSVACLAEDPEPAPPEPSHPHVHPPETAVPGPAPAPPTSQRSTVPTKVKDPICGMTIDPKKAAGQVTRNGVTTYFCSATCKRTFLARIADGGTP